MHLEHLPDGVMFVLDRDKLPVVRQNGGPVPSDFHDDALHAVSSFPMNFRYSAMCGKSPLRISAAAMM